MSNSQDKRKKKIFQRERGLKTYCLEEKRKISYRNRSSKKSEHVSSKKVGEKKRKNAPPLGGKKCLLDILNFIWENKKKEENKVFIKYHLKKTRIREKKKGDDRPSRKSTFPRRNRRKILSRGKG